MLLSAVSVLVVAQSSSEILERLMNNPVFYCVNSLVKPAMFQYSDSAAGWTNGYPEIVILVEAELLSL